MYIVCVCMKNSSLRVNSLSYLYRWLVKNHREQQAIEVLRRVGDGSMSNQDLENEFSEIRKAVRLAEHKSFKEKLMLLLNWKVMQR